MASRFRFSIDRGGTFTDILCEIVSVDDSVTKRCVCKLLSEDPANYRDAPTEGIRRLLEQETGISHPRSVPVDTSRIEYIRMGTTVATNALLERNGERCALLITKGFLDLLRIGNQSRPKIFDLEISRPELLYDQVHEVDERICLAKDRESLGVVDGKVFVGMSGEELYVEKSLDEFEVKQTLELIYSSGIRSIAIVFLHAYTFSGHEEAVKKLATEVGFEQISLSSEVMPMVRIVPRGCTTCVDAYLTPIIRRYLKSFCSGFDAGLSNVQVSFMQSDGGLTPMDAFFGNRAILSGPAGGVVGYAMTSYSPGCSVIGFDMGGTDANLVLGRIQPHLFPAIFGPHENEQLDLSGVQEAFAALTKEINDSFEAKGTSHQYSVEEVAFGFIRVANEAMARPIRNLTTMKGYDVTKHALSCFGGAGPQHCCAIAKSLGMQKIYVHKYSGILSAFGLSLADIVVERQEAFSGTLSGPESCLESALVRLKRLETDAKAALFAQGFREVTRSLYNRCERIS
jgi:N-methylhydantoinase A/oxoprolinase/acetone carboxylase beta subunit